MDYQEIAKPSGPYKSVDPNLVDYASTRKEFDWWSEGFEKMDWLPDGGLNNAYEAVDRHVVRGHGDKLAMIWLGKNGEEERYTYSQFKEQSDRFGAVYQTVTL